MSAREAARRAGISEGRYRQIEAGYQSVGGGQRFAVNVPAGTAIAVARAVGLDPAEAVRLAGHDPEEYADLLAPVEDTDQPVPYDAYGELAGLPAEDRAQIERVVVEMARMLKRARGIT